MILLELLGRRWSLRILWELKARSYNFRDLRLACGNISPTILNTRLAELRTANLVALNVDGYYLTDLGHSLGERFMPLYYWAEDWLKATKKAKRVMPRAPSRKQ